jgi:hypothetical protein
MHMSSYIHNGLIIASHIHKEQISISSIIELIIHGCIADMRADQGMKVKRIDVEVMG